MLLPLAVGCGPKTKPDLVNVDYWTYRAAQITADTETLLSRAGTITAEQSRTVYRALEPATDLGLECTHILQLWDPEQPMPPQLPKLMLELWKIAQVIIGLLPIEWDRVVAQAKAVTPTGTPDETLAELDILWRQLAAQIDRRWLELGRR